MSSPGFNAGGGAGSSEFFSGRSQNTINNLITTTNHHNNHHLLPSLYRTQHHQQQPLPPIFLDPSSQIQQNRFIGKRTLAEFQTQQQNHGFNNLNLVNNNNNNVNFNKHHVLSNLLLRSVKPRTTTTSTSTTNFQFHGNNNTHTTPLSFSLPELQQYPYHQTQRLGVPLLHQPTINPNFHHYRNSNLSSNLSQITSSVQPVQTTVAMSGKIQENNNNNNDHTLLQELEKQLLEDNDEEGETETASVITTSEWSETYQNLIGPGLGPGTGQAQAQAQAQAQKLVSSSPTSSTTSSTSSSAASPASVCSKQTLIEAANAISEGKNDVALEILNRLVQNLNLNSMNSDQRLANFMVRALKSRMNPVENPPVVAELFGREHAESTQLLLENSVCFKVGFMAANLAILEAAFEENGNSFCVVDFEIGQGKQYVNLLHALKAREAAREGLKLKIVAVAENGGDDRVIAVGEMLRLQAEKLRIGFEFRVVSVSQRQVYELTRELLGCDVKETIIVNFAYKLNRIPDESVSTENPRDTLLRRVKTLAPRVVVIVEQEMNCNTAPFLARVAESWGYYSALCDSVEENSDRVKIEEGVGRKLCNLVACEGRDRVERCEVFGKWRARMSMAGFKMKPMSQNVAESIKSRLNIGNNESRVNSGLSVKEENGGICFGWMGRTLTVASVWR